MSSSAVPLELSRDTKVWRISRGTQSAPRPAAWVIFLIFVPFLAALVYLIARGDGMRERALAQQQEAQKQLDTYIRQTASSGGGGSAADELTKLSKLHDEKKLSDEEFERAKAKIVA